MVAGLQTPQPLEPQIAAPSPRPLVVVWRVLDHCNLACPFCAYDRRLSFVRQISNTAEVARFIELLGDWSQMSGRPVLLSWLGGEPTIWQPLESMSRLAKARGFALSLTSNGTTLGSSSMRRLLTELFDEVTFSIDGFSDVHDAMRGWPGAFEKLKLNIQRLAGEKRDANAKVRLKANVVLMRRNIDQFAPLCLELSAWGIEEITYNQLGGRDRPEFFPDNRLRPRDVETLRRNLPSLREGLAARGTRLLGGELYLRRIEESSEGLPLAISDCRVADSFLFIDESGVVAPCNFVGKHFGLTTHELKIVDDIGSLAIRLNQHQRCHPSPACSDCMSTQQFSKFDC